MRKYARRRTIGLMLLTASACFQSDFVLYGPTCEDASECEGALGERSDGRVCFFPRIDQALGPGYCTVACELEQCAAQGGLAPECLTRSTQDGRELSVCAFFCVADDDCPERMTCMDDPHGGERKLCVP
ncbi:hypothetical protein [Nannocystis radixulma]|uniref:Lipoprotein n=1 Tax=Nannocystis radixulma TaxID=2995305 RepID=A0ABT5BH72_9BACT|nr:hypothetical protein [Nannocystis radixulma]MDC0673437.1 hypothetical protein [Nannocystis radixulma]